MSWCASAGFAVGQSRRPSINSVSAPERRSAHPPPISFHLVTFSDKPTPPVMADASGILPVDPRPPSAPYGQACTACSKAKTRCIGRGPQTACERCRRLDRQCQPSAVLRKSRTPKRPRPNNTAVLEKKLDELASLLSIRARAPGETSGIAAEEGHAVVAQADGVGPETASRPFVSSSNTPIGTNRVPGPSDESRSSAEDEECLETFRDCHLQSFPFYQIPPGTTYDVQIKNTACFRLTRLQPVPAS